MNLIVEINDLKRVTVKVTASTTIRQIIDEACKQVNFESSNYAIKYQKKILDMTSTVRLCSLPAGARLELVKSITRDGQVSVGLQIEGQSQRHTLQLNSLLNLLDILSFFEAQFSLNILRVVDRNGFYMQPTVVILNQSFEGVDNLASVTLSKIGINSGNILIRLSFKSTQMKLEDLKFTTASNVPTISTTPTTVNDVIKNTIVAPTSTKEESKMNEVTNSKEESEVTKSVIINPVDRQVKLFKTSSLQIDFASLDLPDSFYELSDVELKYVLASYSRKTQELKNAPLKTKKMREEEEAKKREKYPKTLVRFKFSDGILVQAVFLSSESASNLYEFMSSILVESSPPFTLLLLFPRKQLSCNDSSLYDLNLVPASNIVVEFHGESKGNFLLPDLLCKAEVLESPKMTAAPAEKEEQKPMPVKEEKEKKKAEKSTIDQKLAKWLNLKPKK